MLESSGEVIEVRLEIGEGKERIAVIDAEEAPHRSFDGDGGGLGARQCPDPELLRDESCCVPVDVDYGEEGVEFGVLDSGYVNGSAVGGVALVVSVRRAVTECTMMGVIAGVASWCAILRGLRGANVRGVEECGVGLPSVRCLRVAEAVLWSRSAEGTAPAERRESESVRACADHCWRETRAEHRWLVRVATGGVRGGEWVGGVGRGKY